MQVMENYRKKKISAGGSAFVNGNWGGNEGHKEYMFIKVQL
jgi:hypothetical protein